MTIGTTMMRTTLAFQLLVRATGAIQIVLGLLFWAGVATSLVSLHMVIGLILVLGLWALAVLGLRGGAHSGLVVLAAVWGIAVPLLGMTQDQLLTGSMHWLIQVLHLLVGVAAIGMAESLASQIRQPHPAPAEA